jgi:hemerythrin
MEKAEYPDLKEHFAIHVKFIEKVGELMKKIESEALGSSIGLEAAVFLAEWLQKHIKCTYNKYQIYMLQKKIR